MALIYVHIYDSHASNASSQESGQFYHEMQKTHSLWLLSVEIVHKNARSVRDKEAELYKWHTRTFEANLGIEEWTILQNIRYNCRALLGWYQLNQAQNPYADDEEATCIDNIYDDIFAVFTIFALRAHDQRC